MDVTHLIKSIHFGLGLLPNIRYILNYLNELIEIIDKTLFYYIALVLLLSIQFINK